MPPHSYYCAHLQCPRSTRADKDSSRNWHQSGFSYFWPEDWGIKDNEDKICRECYDEKLVIQKSLKDRPQTRHGPIIPNPSRPKATKRGEAELLSTPQPTEFSSALMHVPAARCLSNVDEGGIR